jgi:TRAP-type C4-dicarboxylate transport system substrate-binding protein
MTHALLTRRSLAVGAAALAGSAALPRDARAALTLKYANAAGPQTNSNLFNVELFKEIERLTNGNVKAAFSYNVGGEKAIVDAMALGGVDVCVTAYTGTREFDILYSPGMFRDGAHAGKVMKSAIGQKASQVMEQRYKARLLGTGRLGPYCLFMKNEIKAFEDIKGKKIRTPPIEGCIEAVKFLGGNPTPVPFNEVYLALQQGIVDGMVTALNVAVAQKFNEACKFVVANEFGQALDKQLISTQAWNRLSTGDRDIVQKTFDRYEEEKYYKAGVDAVARDLETWEKANGKGTVLRLAGDPAKTLEPLNKRLMTEVFGPGSWEQMQAVS